MPRPIEPLVFIGMPIWNCEATLRISLESIIRQEYINWKLFISDNHSTDNSFQIARDFSKLDHRITLFRQEENIGPERNFLHVLENSEGDFFKFQASDDVLSPDYLTECIALLELNKRAVGACVIDGWDWEFESNSQLNTFSLAGKQNQRFSALRENCWRSNGVFYGVYRRLDFLEAAKHLNSRVKLLNPDWLVLARLIKVGEIVRSKKGHLILGSKGVSNSDSLHWWKQLDTAKQKLLPYRFFITLLAEGTQRITHRSRFVIYLWVFGMYVNHYKGVLMVLIGAHSGLKKNLSR
jgi:glycosyltransferase involved in cell wall biosynthesis